MGGRWYENVQNGNSANASVTLSVVLRFHETALSRQRHVLQISAATGKINWPTLGPWKQSDIQQRPLPPQAIGAVAASILLFPYSTINAEVPPEEHVKRPILQVYDETECETSV